MTLGPSANFLRLTLDKSGGSMKDSELKIDVFAYKIVPIIHLSCLIWHYFICKDIKKNLQNSHFQVLFKDFQSQGTNFSSTLLKFINFWRLWFTMALSCKAAAMLYDGSFEVSFLRPLRSVPNLCFVCQCIDGQIGRLRSGAALTDKAELTEEASFKWSVMQHGCALRPGSFYWNKALAVNLRVAYDFRDDFVLSTFFEEEKYC